ncbi:MAG TPA: GtrA family protein [Chitinophagaceae bacterium]
MKPLLTIIKFGIVGLSGMAIDFFITWICKERLLINKYIANSLGFSVAVVNNFFLNYYWTFHKNDNNINIDFIKFILFAVVGLILNNVFLFLFNSKLKFPFYVAKALAILCVFVWNFTSNYFFNFHS